MNRPFIIDRSDLDEVIVIRQDGTRGTRREELEKFGWMRTDVCLFNGASGKQYILNVGTNVHTDHGYVGDLWLLEILTPVERDELDGIATRMRQNALDHHFAAKLVVHNG